MGWTKDFLGRLVAIWPSKKKSSTASSDPPPVFAVDWTEVPVAATATGVPELTLRDLKKATRSFSPSMLIGPGRNTESDTAVYRASLPVGRNNGKAAAVAKRLLNPPSGTWTASDDEFLRQQVLVLSRLRHDNVVRLLGYTIDTAAGVRVLLFEFAGMGTLHDALHGTHRAALSWAQRAGIALDVARGLEYLHDVAGVGHYGISSTNVLLFHGCRAKIADYDIFKQRPQDDEVHNAVVLSGPVYLYCPPEYAMTGRRCSPKFDVYCYGALLLELLTGRKKYQDAGYPWQWADSMVRKGRVEGFMDPKLGTHYPPAQALKLARIALSCLERKPESRPSMADVAQMISCHVVSSETTMAK